MTQYVQGPDGVLQMYADNDPRAGSDPIAAQLASQGYYQSPEGWAIIGGPNAPKEVGGAPRIFIDANGKQPPASVLQQYPMAPPQEQQAAQQRAAQYNAGEGKPVPFATAVLTALGSFAGGSLLGGATGTGAGTTSLGNLAATDLAGTGGVGTSGVAGSSNLGALTGAGGAFDMGGTAGALGEGASGAGVDGVQAGIDAANSGSGYSLRGITDAESGLGGAGSAVGAAAGAAAKGSALSRILDGSATAADYLSVGGAAAPGLLGALASSNASSKLSDLATQYTNFGAPSRARYEASYAPGFSIASDPGYQDSLDQAAKAENHALSVNGNPAGSPNAQAQTLLDLQQKTAYPALQAYRNTNASSGGLATGAAAAPGLATSAINQNSTTLGDIGGAISAATNQNPTLADLLKKLGGGSSNIFAVQ